MMTIGVDATCWTNRRGYGRHLRALLTAALQIDRRNRYVFFIDSDQAASQAPAGVDVVRVAASRPAVEAARSDGRRTFSDLWTMFRALSSPGLDCLLFPTVYTYVPVISRAHKIVIIHDVIPEKFPQHVFPSAAGRWNWTVKSFLARRQADLILTVSDFSRRGILERFGERPERVKVVGEAGDAMFHVKNSELPESLRVKGLVPGRYFVFVGGFSPHKNLDGLLEAFAAVSGDVKLVLAGDFEGDAFHSCYAALLDRVTRLGLTSRVVFTGYISDQDLVALLNLGTALVLPSFLEGFGLPAIEAAACGLPVIATKASPLPELLGDAALLIHPREPKELVRAMQRVLDDADLRGRMREAGLRAAAALSWDRAARDLISIFEQVAEGHARAA